MPDTPLTPVEVLLMSSLEDRARYGYELVERIGELSGGRVSVRPGNLYRVLHRLADRGLVEGVAASQEDDDRRQYFCLTGIGRSRLVAELRMYAGVLEGLSDGAILRRAEGA